MTYLRAMTAAVLGAAALAGCGGDDGGPGPQPTPTPGYLTILLDSPRPDDGAVLFSVSGGEIQAVEAIPESGVEVYSSTVGTVTKVVALGEVKGGPLVRIRVPDTRNATDYVASLEEVASRGTYELQSLTPGRYALTIGPM